MLVDLVSRLSPIHPEGGGDLEGKEMKLEGLNLPVSLPEISLSFLPRRRPGSLSPPLGSRLRSRLGAPAAVCRARWSPLGFLALSVERKRGASSLRSGRSIRLLRQSFRVSTFITFSLPLTPRCWVTSMPSHQVMLVDLVSRLSPIHPEMGRTGRALAMKSFFQPTLASMLHISSLISLYRSWE